MTYRGAKISNQGALRIETGINVGELGQKGID
jgi:hypothetical protein